MMHKIGCDEPTAHAIMSRAADAGVNFIDTADVYGQDGLSERVVGNWLAESGRRDEIVLASKMRFRMAPGPNGTGAARYRIARAAEASLRRLRTDRIDLYQIHMQDIETPEEETLRALDDLVRQGKVLYLGCSNYAAYRLVDSLWLSRSQGLERYVSLQALYNLVDRSLEREHIPLCEKFSLGVLPYSPLAGGFLTGKYEPGQAPPAGTRLDKMKERFARYDNERSWRIMGALREVAGPLGASVGQVALAWLLRRPQVSSVIFGARSIEQLDDNLAAAALPLEAAALQQLDEASGYELGYPYEFLRNLQKRW
jgi:aryl-alcohol dehydrogenase-like predicted oxidoreductase